MKRKIKMKSFISTAIICVLFASTVLPAISGEVFASVSVQRDGISVGVNTYGKDNMSGKTDGDSRDSVRILFTRHAFAS